MLDSSLGGVNTGESPSLEVSASPAAPVVARGSCSEVVGRGDREAVSGMGASSSAESVRGFPGFLLCFRSLSARRIFDFFFSISCLCA